jgi:sulfatase modifying factor 1
MGSPAGEAERHPDEAQHQVTLTRGFWLGDSEVTRSFWQAVMGTPNAGAGAGADIQLPATTSWEEGQAFLAKLNAAQPGLGADLPSEAQWEYACRAGTSGPTYAPLDGIAWYLVTSADAYGNNPQHPVKQKQPNAWGLHDMLGNAWEMTRDWYGDPPSGAVTDPGGPAGGNRHVVRGGSSRNAAGSCRAAWRWAEFPAAKGFGLRIMAAPAP